MRLTRGWKPLSQLSTTTDQRAVDFFVLEACVDWESMAGSIFQTRLATSCRMYPLKSQELAGNFSVILVPFTSFFFEVENSGLRNRLWVVVSFELMK